MKLYNTFGELAKKLKDACNAWDKATNTHYMVKHHSKVSEAEKKIAIKKRGYYLIPDTVTNVSLYVNRLRRGEEEQQ